MKSSIRAHAVLAVGFSILALVSTMLPASAAVTSISFVPSTVGGPTATLVEYSNVDEPGLGCAFGYRTVTATMTVSVDGDYRFSDVREGGRHVPAEYSPATTARNVMDGAAHVEDPSSTACSRYTDDVASHSLRAGVTYTLRLRGFAGAIGNGGFLISGPGEVTVNGAGPSLTADRALAACQEGSDVPSGYTLLEGTAKSETLTGTAGKDLIRGLGGNDTIRGLGGDDILCGGEGQDTIQGGDGADFVFGEASQDVLSGGIGEDYLDGGVGNDVLNGNDGADDLIGDDGQDTLYGQAGDDELFGGSGNDVLDGGVGTDEGTDTDPRSVFRNIETVNGPPAPGPQPTVAATR